MAQRGNHLGTLDFEIAAGCDCADGGRRPLLWASSCSKGATLRELESRHNAFLVFDNDTVRDDAKRMYAWRRWRTATAIAETLEAVDARNLASAEKRYLAPWSEPDPTARTRRRAAAPPPPREIDDRAAPTATTLRAAAAADYDRAAAYDDRRPPADPRALDLRALDPRAVDPRLDPRYAAPPPRYATTPRTGRCPGTTSAGARPTTAPYRDYRAAPPPRRDYAPPEPRAYDPTATAARHDPTTTGAAQRLDLARPPSMMRRRFS
ncbi:hypothetical protein JL720_7468 [Aureococcus anophagefferens]|nr:hypothetical protein JL720_7468 [Aureococcus anophagefferens]